MIKPVIKSIFLLGLLTVATACNNNKEKISEGHVENARKDDLTKTAKPLTQSVSVNLKSDVLNSVYQQYQHLTTALVDGDAGEAKIAAIAIETGARQIKGGEALVASAALVTGGKDIASQRRSYTLLSQSFIALLKQTGISSGELYIAHCPMAQDNKGAFWVTNTKEIRNPYFGQEMLTCGSVTETLK